MPRWHLPNRELRVLKLSRLCNWPLDREEARRGWLHLTRCLCDDVILLPGILTRS